MYEKICCIYDADENYAVRLAEAMNNNGGFPLRVMAFTSKEALLKCMTEYEVELLLVGEQLDKEVRDEFPSTRYFVIGEGDNDLENNTISRYQSTERIIRQILYKLGTGSGEVNTTCRTGITAFYSPSGSAGKSLLAVAYAHSKGCERRILYINLEEFSGIRELFKDNGKSMSDAIYYYYVRKEEPLSGIMNCIGRDYGFDYLSPVTCPDDIGDLCDEDLWKMIELIRNSEVYDEIVLDMGNLIRKPWVILSECNRIIVPENTDCTDKRKQEEFENFLERRHLCNIKEAITRVAFDAESFGNIPLKLMVSGNIMDKVVGGL